MMRRLHAGCQLVQPHVALNQCATMATKVVEVATESEKELIAWRSSMKKERNVRAVSVFGKKIRCGLRFFWRISVQFCGFRTPLTPPSVIQTQN